MPLLEALSSRKAQGCFKYRQQPTLVSAAFLFLHPPRYAADKMSSRVKKTKSLKSQTKLVERNNLLEAILRSPITMRTPCSFCKTRSLVCKASPSDSSACYECVRNHESFCDAQGVTVQQLNRIVSQHDKLETQMEDAEAELAAAMAKVNRLRKQKRMWFEKMARAISRGVDTVEELEEVERKEAEALSTKEALPTPPAPSTTLPLLSTDFVPL